MPISIMTYNGKKEATTSLKKPHKQNRELGNIQKWRLLMGGVQVGRGMTRGLGGDRSVNGGDGERLLSKFSPTFS